MESDKFILIEPNDDNTASTWAYDYDTDSWEQMSDVEGISNEYWGSAVYDIESDLVILTNANGAGNLHLRFRVYDYNTDTWDDVNGLGYSDYNYIGEYWGTTAYDIRSDRVYLFSGHGSNGTIISSFVHEELSYETHYSGLDGAYWGDGSSGYDYESDRALLYNNRPSGSLQNLWHFNYETGLGLISTTQACLQIIGCVPL